MKRIFNVLTVLTVCVLLTAGAVWADIPAVTFTNTLSENADLKISKIVVNSLPGYTADPDTLFTFHVSRNGKAYSDQEYTVTDANGDEIVQYDSDHPSVQIPWKTDGRGDFQLKDGWTAAFAYFGSGAYYEVFEQNIPEECSQIDPAPGIGRAGVLGKKGAILYFKNGYKPQDHPEFTNFTITKRVIMPQDYIVPETPAFIFEIRIDGSLFAGQTFMVKDAGGNILRVAETDENGCLQLHAEETAVFEELESGVDYQVREYQTEGWRNVGAEVQEGELQGRSTDITFVNRFASIAVRKEVEGDDPDHERFTFALTQIDGQGIAGAAYYLYTDPAETSDEVFYTDNNGLFSLAADETAIFCRMEPNITYHIRELHKNGWQLVVPGAAGGYTGKTKDETVPVLLFVNAPHPDGQSLYVSKQVTGQPADQEDEFKMVLEVLKEPAGDAEEFEPVRGAVYQISKGYDAAEQYRTDEQDGTFTLHGEETAQFQNLPKGTYRIRELSMPRDYTLIEDQSVLRGELNSNLYLLVTNHHEEQPRKGSISIRKLDGSDQPLDGVEFVLTKQSSQEIIAQSRTDEAGEILFDDLDPDIYVLTETASAAGRELLSEPITIAIPLTLTQEEAAEMEADTSRGIFDQTEKRWYFYDLKYEITNHAVLEMPLAGGRQNPIGWMIGFICLIAAALIRTAERRCRNENI